MTRQHSKYIQTSDGVTLHYLEAGSGPPLLMIPGWSQTAEEFKYQIHGLSDRYHCLAIDMRGHGRSEKVNFGYNIPRFAEDLHDVLNRLDLNEVAILGHSLGCSVLWCYWDMFGGHRLAKLILVDQPPVLMANPNWSQSEREASGAPFDEELLQNTCTALTGLNGEKATVNFVGNMLRGFLSEEEKGWIIEQNLQLPRQYAVSLLKNAMKDWRDIIPRITIPTLVIGGKASHVSWKSQVWIHESIPHSKLLLFEEGERGHHFMFISCPHKFNQAVAKFLSS